VASQLLSDDGPPRPDVVSLRDESLFETRFIAGHRQVTDVYLLGLAKKKGGRLVTFDRTIPLKAVKGSTPDHLEVLTDS
jgi:uncharacterized protein